MTDVSSSSTLMRRLRAVLAVAAAVSASTSIAASAPSLGDGGGVCDRRIVLRGSPLVVGDSITYDAARHLHARGFGVDARVCRPMSDGVSIIRARRPPRAVLALGTNGRATTAQLDAAYVASGTLVLVAPAGDDGDAELVRRFGARHRLRVVDWARLSRLHPSWIGPDGIHPTAVGALAYARLIVKAAR